ncbi:hypothetical protein [Robertkochia sediminum]|nr:hypothetical protein [Robertkochia sediminum]MBL7473451.1 hypothetical protein [Robertkochia sediminum]
MANLYISESSKQKQLKPRKETIRFLLDYSKALSVTKYKEMTFETISN